MNDVIYWTGPGYYYPARQKSDDGEWFTVWTYRTDEPLEIEGMGTPRYFKNVPTQFTIINQNGGTKNE